MGCASVLRICYSVSDAAVESRHGYKVHWPSTLFLSNISVVYQLSEVLPPVLFSVPNTSSSHSLHSFTSHCPWLDFKEFIIFRLTSCWPTNSQSQQQLRQISTSISNLISECLPYAQPCSSSPFWHQLSCPLYPRDLSFVRNRLQPLPPLLQPLLEQLPHQHQHRQQVVCLMLTFFNCKENLVINIQNSSNTFTAP
jgi:hypothetical protein